MMLFYLKSLMSYESFSLSYNTFLFDYIKNTYQLIYDQQFIGL